MELYRILAPVSAGVMFAMASGAGAALGQHVASSVANEVASSGPIAPDFDTGLHLVVERHLREVNAVRAAKPLGAFETGLEIVASEVSQTTDGFKVSVVAIDHEGPRELAMAVDVFDRAGRFVTTVPQRVLSQTGQATLAVELEGEKNFASFSVRFFSPDGGHIDVRRSVVRDLRGPIAAENQIEAADYPAMTAALASLGYAKGSVVGQEAMLTVIKRFRRAYGLSGPEYVSVGDWLALQAAAKGRSASSIDLARYPAAG